MATNFRVKIGKIGLLTYIRSNVAWNGLQYHHSDFKKFISDDLATLCVNLVNFGPVTPELNIAKCVQRSFLSLRQNLLDKLPQESIGLIFTIW